jgi:hypothetical protein
MTMTEHKLIMTPRAAGEYLGGIAIQTLARWRVEGRGPQHLKLGGAVRYDVRDLDSWLVSRRRSSTAEKTDGETA